MSENLPMALDGEMPVFRGTSFEEHVETWRAVDESMQNHLWMLGAIAASLVKKYGEDSTGRFASRVGCSRRRVQEYAMTYHEWGMRERSRILPFSHHTIAARDDKPEEVIEMAEVNGWSVADVRDVVKERRSKSKGAAKYGKEREDEDVEREAVMICPHCDGAGVVPYRGGKR